MKSYWLGSDKKKRKFFKDYASCYNMELPDNSDILLIAEEDGSFSGFSAVVSNKYSSDIVFFLIPEEKRRKGCGWFMLREIEQAVINTNISLLRCIMPSVEGLPAFFQREGFDLFSGESEYAVSFGSLKYSSNYRSLIAGKEPLDTKALAELDPPETTLLKSFLLQEGLTGIGYYNNKLSSVTMVDGKILALLLCDGLPSGVVINYMFAAADHPEYLLNGFKKLDQALSVYGEKADKLKISFSTGNPQDYDLIKKITDDVVSIDVITREVIAVKQCLPENH